MHILCNSSLIKGLCNFRRGGTILKRKLGYTMLIPSIFTTIFVFQMATMSYYTTLGFTTANGEISFLSFINLPALCLLIGCFYTSFHLLCFDKLKELYKKAHS